MSAFVTLCQSARKSADVPEFLGDTVAEACDALLDRAHERGSLPVEGVWRLARRTGLDLTHRTAITPPGGWRALCSLIAGTGRLKAEEDRFSPRPLRSTPTRIDLLEAFTRYLFPPATAAGVFLAMNIHPLWGLRLARRLHVDALHLDGPPAGWKDSERHMPDEGLRELRRGVAVALSIIVEGLSQLRPTSRYNRDALVAFIAEALTAGRDEIADPGTGLEILIDAGGTRAGAARSLEFGADEIINGVLIPAGVACTFVDGSIAIDGPALATVKVDTLTRQERGEWFAAYLEASQATLAVHVQ